MSQLNERLTEARIAKGMNKTAFAKAVRVSQPTVTDWENGKMRPKGENLIRICHVLGIAPEWLLNGRGSPESTTPHPAPPPTVRDLLESLRDEIEAQPEDIRRLLAQLVGEYLAAPSDESGRRVAAMIEAATGTKKP